VYTLLERSVALANEDRGSTWPIRGDGFRLRSKRSPSDTGQHQRPHQNEDPATETATPIWRKALDGVEGGDNPPGHRLKPAVWTQYPRPAQRILTLISDRRPAAEYGWYTSPPMDLMKPLNQFELKGSK